MSVGGRFVNGLGSGLSHGLAVEIEALGEIGGVVRKPHCFAMSLPHSDAFCIKACPAETTEAFCDGHVAGFAFFGGVPLSGLYDNTTIAVARILGDGTRQRTRTFAELQSHYLFEDRFGRPGKGNDKGNVEGTIGYGRRNFLVPPLMHVNMHCRAVDAALRQFR